MTVNNIILTQISNLNQAKILVVGDVMLDRYWFGDVNRISPEAPVPIAKINRAQDRPGGAANVARNIASLGGNVTLLSVIGDDEAGNDLDNLLQQESVHTIFKRDPEIKTIVKLRVLSKNQQLLRIDFEEKPSHEILAEILDNYNSIINDYDVVILSDYGKGGLSHTVTMIKVAKQYNKIILVDPKGADYTKYAGATIITPNKNELRDAAGDWKDEAELNQKAMNLKQQLGLSYLLLTRSEEGMTLYTDTNTFNYQTVAREVYDVSGAGDTVIATLGLMLGNKISIENSVLLANIAAGVVVAKVGTATLNHIELIQAINKQNHQ